MNQRNRSSSVDWPELPFADWSDTAATLHMWAQIVGKIRLSLTPWTNHSWHVPLYVTARGLSTSLIPYGGKAFEINFDFIDHQLVIQTIDGAQRRVPLEPCSVSDFYAAVLENLRVLELDISIYTTPSEMPDAIPFDQDNKHHHYDPEL